MHKLNVLGLLFLVILLFTVTALAGSVSQPRLDNNFLWQIKTDDNTVYLLGSIHVLKKDSYPLDQEIEDAYKQSEKVVFETDVGSVNSPAFQAEIMTRGIYTDGTTLEQNVSEQTYGLLRRRVDEYGLPVSFLNSFKPWLAGLTLVGLELLKLGFDPNYGVDAYFFAKAKEDNNKNTGYLETADYQISLLSDLSNEEQEVFLRQTLNELQVMEKMLSDMISSWKNGDTAQFESIIKMSFETYPGIYEKLFVQRNKNWVSKIREVIEGTEKTLIIVGAGHLVGEGSVIDLLRKKGYVVEQL